MAPNGVRDGGTDTNTRAGTDWGRAGAMWGALGVVVAIVGVVVAVLQLVEDDGSTPYVPPPATSTATAPAPTTEPLNTNDPTADPATDSPVGPTQSAPSRPAGQSPNRVPAARQCFVDTLGSVTRHEEIAAIDHGIAPARPRRPRT